MRRFALLAVFQCFAIMAFCQLSANTSGTGQTSLNKRPAPLSLFNFDSSQFAKIPPAANFSIAERWDGQGATQNQADVPADARGAFHAPCMDVTKLVEMASNNSSIFPLPTRRWPTARGEPIPTQWPNARFEPIPTTWTDLKLQQISGHVPGSVPAK